MPPRHHPISCSICACETQIRRWPFKQPKSRADLLAVAFVFAVSSFFQLDETFTSKLLIRHIPHPAARQLVLLVVMVRRAPRYLQHRLIRILVPLRKQFDRTTYFVGLGYQRLGSVVSCISLRDRKPDSSRKTDTEGHPTQEDKQRTPLHVFQHIHRSQSAKSHFYTK